MDYVACQQSRNGVLFISEFSGTASNMPEAIKVDSWESTQVPDQIHKALIMAAGQRKRVHDVLCEYITTGNVQFYVNNMLQRLVQVLNFRR